MTLKALVQRVHLWSGLLLGIQMLFWMLSGLVMSAFPIELVRGETTAFSAPPVPLEAQTFASPGGIIAQVDGVTSLELRRFLGRPAYLTSGQGAARALFDAASGEKLSPLSTMSVRARLLALHLFRFRRMNIAVKNRSGASITMIATIRDFIFRRRREKFAHVAMIFGGCMIFSGCCTSWIMMSGRIPTLGSFEYLPGPVRFLRCPG